MFEVLMLSVLLGVLAVVSAAGMLVWVVLKAVLWLVLLPLRLLFGLLVLPFLLLKMLVVGVVGGALALLALPLIVIGGVIGLLGLLVPLAIAAAPFLLLAALVWLVMRASSTAIAPA